MRLLLILFIGWSAQALANNKFTSSSCELKYRARLNKLACVACGLESYNPADTKSGVDHWISLLGIMAQERFGPFNLEDQGNLRRFQLTVIQMLTSYGYCNNGQYDLPQLGALGELPRRWLDRPQSRPFHLQEKEIARQFGKAYGIECEKENPADCMAKVFADTATEFENSNVQSRQWRFRARLEHHLEHEPSSAFSQCADSVTNRLKLFKPFSFCPIQIKHGQAIYSETISNEALAANTNLYEKLTQACGLDSQREFRDRVCDYRCVLNAELANCRAAPQDVLSPSSLSTTPSSSTIKSKK